MPKSKVLNSMMRGHQLCGIGIAAAIAGKMQTRSHWGRATFMTAAGAAVFWRAAAVVPGLQRDVNFAPGGIRQQWHAFSSFP